MIFFSNVILSDAQIVNLCFSHSFKNNVLKRNSSATNANVMPNGYKSIVRRVAPARRKRRIGGRYQLREGPRVEVVLNSAKKRRLTFCLWARHGVPLSELSTLSRHSVFVQWRARSTLFQTLPSPHIPDHPLYPLALPPQTGHQRFSPFGVRFNPHSEYLSTNPFTRPMFVSRHPPLATSDLCPSSC